jgi:hypothetical protein
MGLRVVNGYPCHTCAEEAQAKRGYDPRAPETLPGGARSALDGLRDRGVPAAVDKNSRETGAGQAVDALNQLRKAATWQALPLEPGSHGSRLNIVA